MTRLCGDAAVAWALWLAIPLTLLLGGCDLRQEWQTAISTYSCSADQMKKVEEEATWCKVNTDYYSSYCYGTAIMRNCTKGKI